MHYKKNIVLIFLFGFIVFGTGCAGIQQNHLPAPTQLPGITRDMNRPGFWISRHSHPDKILMGLTGIDDFNRHVGKGLGFIRNIVDVEPIYDGKALARSMEKRIVKQRFKHLYLKNGRLADRLFYRDMTRQMNIKNIPHDVVVRYGVVSTYTDQRVLPTCRGMYSDSRNREFDRLQNSALDLGTAVAVLHDSADGQWQYVLSSLSAGWVKTETLALCSQNQLRAFKDRDSFVVVTGAKVDIYRDPRLTKYYDHVRMGTRLGMAALSGDVVQVKIPVRNARGRLEIHKGYVCTKKVSKGFLPYTPRNIITQAFECLNAPYGWGGMHGEQDCSRFMNSVFATVGIQLPRNSSAQAKAGVTLGAFGEHADSIEKGQVIHDKAEVGSTLLHLNGHIMLYLGEVEGHFYVIHSLWGYGGTGNVAHQIRVVNGVKVSSLDLGSGSVKGSLLERLKTIVMM
ncbi:SH3 domain-containing protein [Desulfocicer vacuolatum]|nr:SH3 domain-containing protein [Desulfocicer vacuolatum]